MATKSLDDRLDVIEERLHQLQAVRHQVFAPVKTYLQRLTKLAENLELVVNKLSILDRWDQQLPSLHECSTHAAGLSNEHQHCDQAEVPLAFVFPREPQRSAEFGDLLPGVVQEGVGFSQAGATVSPTEGCVDARCSHTDLNLHTGLEPHEKGKTVDCAHDAGLGLRIAIPRPDDLSSHKNHELRGLLERRHEHEDLGSFLGLGHSRGTASLLLQPLDGVRSQPLELGCTQGSSQVFERTGIGQEHDLCTDGFDDGEGLSSRRGAGLGRQYPRCKDFGSHGFWKEVERLGPRDSTETIRSRDAAKGVAALELRGTGAPQQPRHAGAIESPRELMGFCNPHAGTLGLTWFHHKKLAHEVGKGGDFELGIKAEGDLGSKCIVYQCGNFGDGFGQGDSKLDPIPGISPSSDISFGPIGFYVSSYGPNHTIQLRSIQKIELPGAEAGEQIPSFPLTYITVSEMQLPDRFEQWFRHAEGRITLAGLRGSGRCFGRTGIGQQQGVNAEIRQTQGTDSALSHFRSPIIENQLSTMTTIYKNPGSFQLFHQFCRGTGFLAIDSGMTFISKLNGANEINTLVIGYMEFGQLKFAGKMCHVVTMNYIVTWATMTLSCVESFQTQEGLQQLWTSQFEMEPIPSILCNVLLAIPSNDFVYRYSVISNYATLVAGYEALNMSNKIISQGTKSDWFSPGEVFSACNHLGLIVFVEQYADLMIGECTLVSFLAVSVFPGAMEHGKWVQSYLNQCGLEFMVVIGIAIVNRYGKSGSMAQAEKVFEEMPENETWVFSTLLSTFIDREVSNEPLDMLGEIEMSGMMSNHATILGILSACSQVVLVIVSCWSVDVIQDNHSSEPPIHHYACLVDIRGRVGLFEVMERVFGDILFRRGRFWAAACIRCQARYNITVGVFVWLSNLPLWQAKDCAMILPLGAAAMRVQPYHPMSKGWPPPHVHLEDKVVFWGRGIDRIQQDVSRGMTSWLG